MELNLACIEEYKTQRSEECHRITKDSQIQITEIIGKGLEFTES